MNLVFDKKTLKVVSILENSVLNKKPSDILRCSFPNNYSNLGIWQIDKNLSFQPIHLRIKVDDDNDPCALLYKSKEVYKRPEEERQKDIERRTKEAKATVMQMFPRTFRSSINFDIVKLWKDMNRTLPSVDEALKNLDYFLEDKITPVLWSGPFLDAGGYANMNREIAFRLHNHHIIPKTEVWPTAPQISPLTISYVNKYASLNFRRIKSYSKIHGFTPHPVGRHNGRIIFFTMMETETLHPEFVRICNTHADEIWVPSQHNRRIFQESGVKKDIYVMPLGIDEKLYAFTDNISGNTDGLIDVLGRPLSSGLNSFRFLTLFGWSFRKGTDVLIKSFVEEFTDADDVALIICSRHAGSPDPLHQNVIKSDIYRFAGQVRGGNYPQILLFPHIIPEKDMPSRYKMGHAFVHFSRGEGFSLPQIEASACNLPVISCNNTGMSEYLTSDVAYLVETNEKEMCNPEMNWISHFYHGQLFPKLDREQIEQAKRHMRFVLSNYDEALAKNNIFKKNIFDKYTWMASAERVSKRIKEIG